jgi:hypothetical protein
MVLNSGSNCQKHGRIRKNQDILRRCRDRHNTARGLMPKEVWANYVEKLDSELLILQKLEQLSGVRA